MDRLLVSITDLEDEEIDRILAHAEEFSARHFRSAKGTPRLVGLLFLEASLRTRIGFAAAAARLGWQSVEVVERRESPASTIETFEHTLRTVSGYADIVVVRPGQSLAREDLDEWVASRLINGGDRGDKAEHPTQALIDFFAIQRARGRIGELHIGIVGDPHMRAVRSLLLLLSRKRPKRLSIFAGPTHDARAHVPPSLQAVTDYRVLPEVEDVDVLYVGGIPHNSLSLGERERLLVASPTMSRLSSEAIVLSPLPVIDEIDPLVQDDQRVRMFWQSDQGMFVRMAILEAMTLTEPTGVAGRGSLGTREEQRL